MGIRSRELYSPRELLIVNVVGEGALDTSESVDIPFRVILSEIQLSMTSFRIEDDYIDNY